MVDDIFMTTVLWAALIFVLLEGALLAAIFKFRDRSATAELKQGHGSTAIEVVWTIIPALILAIIAAPTMRAVFSP
jgi:cytochrome c oxidase subunit 2